MAIIGIVSVILAIVIPIGIIALIVHLISKRNANNGEKKDNFEKIIRTIYTYILVLAFLIATIASFISAVDCLADYLLPEEVEISYNDNYDYREKVLDERNDKNRMIVDMITNTATFVICAPMFVYHMNLTKQLIKKEK